MVEEPATRFHEDFLATLNLCCVTCMYVIVFRAYASYLGGRVVHDSQLTGDALMTGIIWGFPFVWFYFFSMILDASCVWISQKMIYVAQVPVLAVALLYLIEVIFH